MTTAVRCPQCHATHSVPGVACSDRFAELLALDHSRTEPWGSRHGLAFSAFVLQHPRDYPPDVRDAAWRMLWRVYVQGVDRLHVAREMRALQGGVPATVPVPPVPVASDTARLFAVTIADLGDFAAERYPALLDAWCRATLAAYGV